MSIQLSQLYLIIIFFFQAEDGIRDRNVTGVQTCALPISVRRVADLNRGRVRRARCDRSGARWKRDRKSTRLNSSHVSISYAVFCLKKKKLTSEKDYAKPIISIVSLHMTGKLRSRHSSPQS